MKKIIYLILVTLICCSVPKAQSEDRYLSVLLMRSTFQVTDGTSTGTVFVLGKPRKGSNLADYVMITATHVLSGFKKDSIVILLRSYVNGKYILLPFQIPIKKNGKPLWKQHPNADVAAMKVAFPSNIDIRLCTTDILASDKDLLKYEVRPGDEVFVLGYPHSMSSDDAGFPILRSGRISSYPLTPVAIHRKVMIDFNVFPGNSGGPVFVQSDNRVYAGNVNVGTVAFIFGLVSEEVKLIESIKTIDQDIQVNHKLGISYVIPAAFIKEIVEQL
jgi:S1-C subfamily serine protease